MPLLRWVTWSTKSDTRLIGHGLGLALVGQVTHRNNGTVEVGSADDPMLGHTVLHNAALDDAAFVSAVFVGAVFTVRFPLLVPVAP